MKRILFLLLILFASTAFAAAPDSITLTPTYESIGVVATFSGDGNNNSTCTGEYQVDGAGSWSDAHPMSMDYSNGECRVSIVLLTPETDYNVRVTFNDPDQQPAASDTASTTTWDETPTEGTITNLPNGGAYTISTSGTANAWLVYQSTPGQTNERTNIVINANYIIVRNLLISGSTGHGIKIGSGNHHIIIEGNEITAWGPSGLGNNSACQTSLFNYQDASGVWGVSGNYAITIQDNTIHDPNGRANYWNEWEGPTCHPRGPDAIAFTEAEGTIVIRYNEIHSDGGNVYNDAIGGENNTGPKGNVNKDFDIYGNIIRDAADDVIEIEGDNKNGRIWGNVIRNGYRSIAICRTISGPLYIWGNLIYEKPSYASDSIKDCNTGAGAHGDTFWYHNTWFDRSGTNYNTIFYMSTKNGTFKNNVFDAPNDVPDGGFQNESTNYMDYNMHRVWPSNMQSGWGNNKVVAIPSYDAVQETYSYFLQSGHSGVDAGTPIDNFNDNYEGTAPDIGYLDRGGSTLAVGPRSDTTAPTLSSSVISSNGTTLTLTFDEAVTQGSGYNDADWDVDCTSGGNDISVTYSSGDGTGTHVYTVGQTVEEADSCNIDFNGDADSEEDGAGNDLAAIVSGSVTNNSTYETTPPTLSTAVIASNGTTLTLSFDEEVIQGAGYADSDWDIDCDTSGDNIVLTYSEGDGTSIHLYTIASAIYLGETCNIDFDGSANSEEDDSGNDLAAIVSGAITNNSTEVLAPPVPDVTFGSGSQTITVGGGSQQINIE